MSARDRHLFSPGPKRILSLDGGGVRGVLSIAFLEALEASLRARHNNPELRLSDYFDLIGGTSTGAIIATGLALGMSAADVKELYFDLAPRVFRRSLLRVTGVQSKFDAAPLMQVLIHRLGERPLESEDLLTGLAIVTKRMDTGSAWVVTNNPRAHYWDDPPDGSYIGNRHYVLRQLVRASTAAPFFFGPQDVEIAKGQPPGYFLDGAVTPHNNPALMLFMLAGIKAYGFDWALGEDKLLILSLGTGEYRETLTGSQLNRMTSAGQAVRALMGLIGDTQSLALTLLQWMSRSGTRWPINSEIGALENDVINGQPLLSFARLDARLEAEWLEKAMGRSFSADDIDRMRQIDEPSAIKLLYAVGQSAAEAQVNDSLFPAAFDLAR